MNRVKKEAAKRRYARGVDGEKIDLREGKTLSTEEWIELLNQHERSRTRQPTRFKRLDERAAELRKEREDNA